MFQFFFKYPKLVFSKGRFVLLGAWPGWVLVTIMTAGLVVVIFAAFRGKITTAISDAIDSVTNGTKAN